ncbi:Protein of unknown function [Propionibacterium freudenreichii subsp. freudenreichii]|uniref:Uncharacterized protein n=1 Tax=Propionibacterium freudenreichii subsp. freudenreichii TaxID=66712 RepID=A0A0B7P144_PROFF|nr:Protein of unknown function [Propionibacterium freudenreichii]CEP27372.1 Protein of unknown function [Propionibacterium freudenreichii subsp. freudenreichii]CEG98914.1 Protein of unknown function [Propionibacterium freudenreichii]CEI28580.1 Protein of unknown function [Propionibacterium freudenreichii]CEI32284.1 Protein of unknown function [Propionibacterium freudenreichii]
MWSVGALPAFHRAQAVHLDDRRVYE